MNELLKFSDAELRARGFSRLANLDCTCNGCNRPIECWCDRVGHRAPFVRQVALPGEAPHVRAHSSYDDCRAKIHFFNGDYTGPKGKRTPSDL